MAQNNKNNRWNLLNRLKTAIKKVIFVGNFNINQWLLVSAMIGGDGGAASTSRRRRSFNERLGLTAIVSSSDDENEDDNLDNSRESCDLGSCSPLLNQKLEKTKSFHLQRTMSFPEEDDVDKRAEMFIENFYRQLRMERQVSMQLRYKQDISFRSFDSNSP